MDLNYLFYRQQVERIRAAAAACAPARRAHEGLAQGYEDRIRRATGNRIAFLPR